MAASQIFFRLRQPRIALRLAIAFTIIGLFLIAPLYLGAQWSAAQSPTAPWYVALVREPFFARIMLFGEGPAFWPLFVGAWGLALAFWGVTIRARRHSPLRETHAANANVSAPERKTHVAA